MRAVVDSLNGCMFGIPLPDLMHHIIFPSPTQTAWLSMLLLSLNMLWAQGPEVVVVSPLVGPTISQNEYRRYDLDEELAVAAAQLDSLRIIPLDSAQFLAFFYFESGESEGRPLPRKEVAALRDAIKLRGRVLLQRYANLTQAWEQGADRQVTVLRWDASELAGEWVDRDPLGFWLRLEDGQRAYVALEEVAGLILPEEEKRSQARIQQLRNRLMGHHYLLTQSALPLEGGEGYYQNFSILFNTLTYTPIRGLSATVGTEVTTLLLSAFLPNTYFIPLYTKLTYSQAISEKWYIGGGVTVAGLLTDQGNIFGGLGNLTTTYQGEEWQATLSLGWGGVQDRSRVVGGITPVQLARNPTVTFSARYPIGRRSSMILESWYIRSGGRTPTGLDVTTVVLLSLGPRLELDQIALDLNLTYFGTFRRFQLNNGNLQRSVFGLPIPIPTVGATFFFGQR